MIGFPACFLPPAGLGGEEAGLSGGAVWVLRHWDPNWRRLPESEDSEDGWQRNEFRVFRFAVWLAVEPPNHHTLRVQQPRRAVKSEDSENERFHNQFRVFRFSAWLAAEP